MNTHDTLRQIVEILRRCDPDYVAAHGCEPASTAEWDQALEAIEALLEEMEERA